MCKDERVWIARVHLGYGCAMVVHQRERVICVATNHHSERARIQDFSLSR